MADPTDFLARYAARTADLYAALGREQLAVGAGLKPRLESGPIYATFADLFAPAPVTHLIARRGESRAAAHLAEAGALGFLAWRTHAETELLHHELCHTRATVAGSSFPLNRLPALVAAEPDRGRRRALFAAEVAASARQNGQRFARLQRQHAAACELGVTSYTALCDELRGLRLGWLAPMLHSLLTATEVPYHRALAERLAPLGITPAQAEYHDLLFLLRAPAFDALFPPTTLLPALRETLAAMGLALAAGAGIRLDLAPRPAKSARAFCLPIRVPGEVYLVAQPRVGQRDAHSLFHEAGHALHFAHIAAALPFALARLGDGSISEGYAFLFEGLLRDPAWGQATLGWAPEDPRVAAFHNFARFRQLFFVRRYAARLLWEIELHADPTPTQAEHYAATLGAALGVAVPPARFLADLDDAFASAHYLGGWLLAAHLRRHLAASCGPHWFRERAAGELLRALWAEGQSHPAEALARRWGAPDLDPAPLLADLGVAA